MFRDIKVNYMQWTKGELRKKYETYHKLGLDKK